MGWSVAMWINNRNGLWLSMMLWAITVHNHLILIIINMTLLLNWVIIVLVRWWGWVIVWWRLNVIVLWNYMLLLDRDIVLVLVNEWRRLWVDLALNWRVVAVLWALNCWGIGFLGTNWRVALRDVMIAAIVGSCFVIWQFLGWY